MRVLVAIAVLTFAGRAWADSRCYAGTRADDLAIVKLVEQLEIDPVRHEVREHVWMQPSPTTEHLAVAKVADGSKDVTWRSERFAGTGTLFGPAGKWTGYHLDAKKKAFTIAIDARFSDTELTSVTHASIEDRVSGIQINAKAFDCKDLAVQRAALEGFAPDAKHACYDGHNVLSNLDDRIVIQEITEPKRVILLMTNWHNDSRSFLEHDGAKLTFHDENRRVTGTGTFGTKAYTYKLAQDGVDATVEGTLGGPHMKIVSTAKFNSETATSTIDADAFDCKDLAAHQEAVRQSHKAP